MEQRFDLEVVPQTPSASPHHPDPRQAQVLWSDTAADGPRLRVGLKTPISLLPQSTSSTGSQTEPAQQTANKRTQYSVQFTRLLPASRTRSFWWQLWLGCNACSAILVAEVLRRKRKHESLERTILSPWLAATQNMDEMQEQDWTLLPPLDDVNSPLEPHLSLMAERINQLVSHLQNANDRSDLVLGNLQEGVLAVDDASRILLANNALTRLLELNDENYLYRPLLEVVRIPVVTQLIDSVLKERVQREVTVDFGNASRSLRLLARPLPLGDDRQGALLTVRDETLLKRIESVRRDFVANASHELKTPLAAIRAYAETLQMGALDDRDAAEQFVSNIITQADRINGLVQGMLQLSRVQAGTALRIEAFDIGEALTPCIAAAEAMAKNKGVQLEVSIAPSLMIRSDRDGFQTIASNLLSNAVRYTPNKGTVSVSAKQEDSWMLLSVMDTGVGIHPQDLERIFERFYRAEKDRSVDTGGTGLGLSIVKHLVQALDGRVSAESQPNAGSRFDVRLPIGGYSQK